MSAGAGIWSYDIHTCCAPRSDVHILIIVHLSRSATIAYTYYHYQMHFGFIRHGESVGNATNFLSTDIHDQLSEKGHAQSHILREHLKSITLDRIYCSPLLRALQTIHPFAEHANMPVEVWPELAEGCWQDDKTIKPENNFRHQPCPFTRAFTSRTFFSSAITARSCPSKKKPTPRVLIAVKSSLYSKNAMATKTSRLALLVTATYTLAFIEIFFGTQRAHCRNIDDLLVTQSAELPTAIMCLKVSDTHRNRHYA